MKKLTGLLALLAIVVVASGCSHSASASIWKGNAGYYARVHEWEEPHFTSSLEGDPVTSELGLGHVTVGSHAGFGDHADGKWVSLNVSVGPLSGSDDSDDSDG